LRKLSELRQEVDAFERQQVAHALAEGASFAAIARDLGLSRQAVHRRFRGLATDELPLVMAPDGRRILQYAREEAAALRVSELSSEHIVLAVLRAADTPAAALLRGPGATLDRARMHVEGTSVRGRLIRRDPEAGDPGALLAAAAQEVRARGTHRIEPEHLLLATLDDPQSGGSCMLRALDLDAERIRAELMQRLEPGLGSGVNGD
jgi:ATP-dependent Clp protease ATP-binding subunit ClpC